MGNLKNQLDLATLVKTHRKTAGPNGSKLSADALAEAAGIGRDTLFRLERGEDVSWSTAMKVLRSLNLVLNATPAQWPNVHDAAEYFGTQTHTTTTRASTKNADD